MAAPTEWNSLPTELCSTSVSRDTFKSRLKSHFYADAIFILVSLRTFAFKTNNDIDIDKELPESKPSR